MALYMSISNLQVQAFDPLLNLQNGTPTNQTKQASKHPLDADPSTNPQILTKTRRFQQNHAYLNKMQYPGGWVSGFGKSIIEPPFGDTELYNPLTLSTKTNFFLPKGVVGAEGSHLYFGDL